MLEVFSSRTPAGVYMMKGKIIQETVGTVKVLIGGVVKTLRVTSVEVVQ